jgi:hypothetical protein
MSNIYRVGQNFTYTFATPNLINVPSDYSQTQVSFLKSATLEDTLVYGGTSPRDSQLVRTATGRYSVSYQLDVAGEWRINERWSDDGFVTTYEGKDLIITVKDDPHGWIDTTLPPLTGYHYVYYGAGTAGITVPATLEGLTRTSVTVRDFVANISPTAQKVYICHPAVWGTPTITLDGFAIDELATQSVLMHDYDGGVIAYMVHESTNLLTDANLSFSVKF